MDAAKEFISSQPNDNYVKDDEEIQEQQVSFTLIIKKADGKLLSGKWLTLDALSFKKFAIQVQKYIKITLGVNDIDQEVYSPTFKSAKSNDGGLKLSDSNVFGKFLNEYEKLHRLQKEIVVIVQMKQKFDKKKKRKQVKEEVLESNEFLSDENNSKKKKMNAVSKISGLTPHQKAIEYPIPSVEEFLKKLDKDEGDNGDFIQFINAFIKQKITVKYIKDLDNNDFQVLGIKTIG
ncbi:hypothetical protein C1645_857584 [Glomus cerebriforme]|uniref:Uncharacterized protein n=1 Tax=Glomus cerebriforme TaxID=658196 RepID=A0A397TET3_9GLOM|nr:hypothetical protein C1645_857584 [Glomus cerebriforme]